MSGKFLLVLALFLPLKSLATFVPEDQIHFESLSSGPAQITEDEFNQVIKEMQTEFAPIVKFHGGNLNIVGDWKSNTLNAYATQSGSTWKVQMYGGLARRPELTMDGIRLVVCHELGHHLGGFPFTGGFLGIFGKWGANEGEADYFATQVCARRIWANDTAKNAEFRTTVNATAKAACDKIWNNENDQNLCYRISQGGESLALTLAGLTSKPKPQFETPDTKVVTKTDNDHPAAQCRLDTYFQGAICPAAFDLNLIPGKKVPQGLGSVEAEKEAALHSCTQLTQFNIGLRPTCWFKPRM